MCDMAAAAVVAAHDHVGVGAGRGRVVSHRLQKAHVRRRRVAYCDHRSKPHFVQDFITKILNEEGVLQLPGLEAVYHPLLDDPSIYCCYAVSNWGHTWSGYPSSHWQASS